MVLLGDEPCLWASIHGIDYRLSPGSFFQPNFHGAEVNQFLVLMGQPVWRTVIAHLRQSIFETISELCELNGTQVSTSTHTMNP